MSFGELLFLAVLALLVFGPRKLPEIARQFAKIMTELRRASNDFRYSLEEEVRDLERVTRAAPAPPPPSLAGTVERSGAPDAEATPSVSDAPAVRP